MARYFGVATFLSLAVFTAAHGEKRHHNLHARQNPPASPSGSGQSSLTVTFAATNPTAIPLSSITASASQRATLPLSSTARAGAVPTLVAGAPPLPDLSTFNVANYPNSDEIPPVNSFEVDVWWDEVLNSSIDIPELEPTQPGTGCDSEINAPFKANESRCWWSCGGCVTENDITECDEKNHWGLTFDDGPANYTSNLLNYLGEVNVKATFFVVGSRVKQFPATLQSQYINGHQIGVHTWSHKALTTLTTREIVAELGWTKKIIHDTLGVTPNMMRPPFGDIDNRVRAISHAMGLTPVMWTRSNGQTFNTQDFDIYNTGENQVSVETIMNKWQGILNVVPQLDKGFITLQHDLYQEFVDMATGYIIPDGLARNPRLTIEPVSTCTKRRLADAYIETNDNSTFQPLARLGIHTPGGPADRPPGSAEIVTPRSIVASLVGGAGLIAGLLF